MTTQTAQTPPEANLWEEGVRRTIEEIAELRTFWRDQRRPAMSPSQRGFVTLFVTEDIVVGIPETRIVDATATAPAGEECEPSITELHTVSLQVQVETYDNQARQRGRFFASRIRTRLRRESARLALETVSTSLIDISAIISAAIPIDNRITSTSTMTVRLHTATCERDKPLGYIDVLRFVPSIDDDGGNPTGFPTFDIDLPDP